MSGGTAKEILPAKDLLEFGNQLPQEFFAFNDAFRTVLGFEALAGNTEPGELGMEFDDAFLENGRHGRIGLFHLGEEAPDRQTRASTSQLPMDALKIARRFRPRSFTQQGIEKSGGVVAGEKLFRLHVTGA